MKPETVWMQILRIVRWLAWAGLIAWAIVCLEHFYRIGRILEGAPQLAALAGSTLVEMVFGYIVVRAIDASLRIDYERAARRLDRS